MKKIFLIAIMLVGVQSVYAKEKELHSLICHDNLHLTFDGQFFSNVIGFKDDDVENLKSLLEQDELNLGVKSLSVSTNAIVGACKIVGENGVTAACDMKEEDDWTRGSIKFSYFGVENDMITITRPITIHNMQLQVTKEVDEHNGSFPTKDTYARLELKMDATVRGKRVIYKLNRLVGRLDESLDSCKFSYNEK